MVDLVEAIGRGIDLAAELVRLIPSRDPARARARRVALLTRRAARLRALISDAGTARKLRLRARLLGIETELHELGATNAAAVTP